MMPNMPLIIRKFISILLFSSFCVHVTEPVCEVKDTSCQATSSTNHSPTISLIETLIHHIENCEGMFNSEKQEFRYIDSLDDYGIFAKEDIPMGTELLKIPWEMLIHEKTLSQVEETSIFCKINRNLNSILESHPTSPYVQYLTHILNSDIPPLKRVPEFFTDTGKEILAYVTGVNLPPEEFTDNIIRGVLAEIDENCPDVTRDIACLYQRKSSFSYMVPLMDLYQHHNHEYLLNTENVGFQDEYVGLRAKRDIAAGEQIHTSRNKCKFCGNTDPEVTGTVQLACSSGFIEPYPQHWRIGQKLDFEVHEVSTDYFNVRWMNSERPTFNDISFLTEEKLRLDQIRDQIYHPEQLEVPIYELNFIQSYHESLSIAIESVLHDINPDIKVEDDYENMIDAHVLAEDENHFRNDRQTCRRWLQNFNTEYTSWPDGQRFSQYQEIRFYENPKTNDKCLELDKVVQICANYRPFYHEPFVHFPAAFLPQMSRIAFVGGGDSMLLHEILKYPHVEKVIGLELDQVVVRNSFRILYTQPHFNDERVEWWFGDATKSLNVLPKEYFGSFDLVMVDLSETVMSFSVTDHLDMVQSLALLTKPDGIFVKNEKYFDKMKNYFDHTVELYLNNNPHICDQHFAMGSNRIDFLHPNFEQFSKYNVETLLYQPLDSIFDHHNMIIQYSKNDARKQNQCQEDFDKKSFDLVKAGVLMILEAEHATLLEKNSPDEQLKAVINALETTGLSYLLSQTYVAKHGGNFSFLSMREGYISMRTWPSYSYAAFDIQFWASFDKMDKLKQSIVNAVGSDDWSSFRIVVCGMHGTNTWEEDKLKIGPKVVSSRDCEMVSKVEVDYQTKIDVLIEESLSMLDNSSLVIVLCGTNECSVASIVKQSNILNVHVITLCSKNDDESGEDIDNVKRYSLCGNNFETLLKLIVNVSRKKIDTLLVDYTVPESFHEVLLKILGRKEYQRSLLHERFITIGPVPGKVGDERKRILTDISRKQFRQPLIMEVSLGSKSDQENNVKVLFMSVGDTSLYSDLANVADKTKERLGIDVNIINMKGKHVTFQDDYEPQSYVLSDYDTEPALRQYSEQEPLGYQSVLQLVKDKNADNDLSFDKILSAFQSSLEDLSPQPIVSITDGSIGYGLLAYTYFEQGHAAVVWDGKERIDLNIFTYENQETMGLYHKEDIAKPFGIELSMELLLVDEQPRGVNHVINLMNDIIDPQKLGCWDKYSDCDYFQNEGNCEPESIYKSWMEDNCALSCGFC